jgi:hypothetical protein
LPQLDRSDVPDPMEDTEGNISMFLAQSPPSISNCDQVMASHEDSGVNHIQRLTDHETAENGDIDVATVNPLSVIPPLEKDVTAQT